MSKPPDDFNDNLNDSIEYIDEEPKERDGLGNPIYNPNMILPVIGEIYHIKYDINVFEHILHYDILASYDSRLYRQSAHAARYYKFNVISGGTHMTEYYDPQSEHSYYQPKEIILAERDIKYIRKMT